VLRLRIDHLRPAEEQLFAAVKAIRDGRIVAFPTDTVYGLAADPRSDAAVAEIFRAKERPPDQPLPLIISDLDQIATAGTLTRLAATLAAEFWPGPLSLVIPASTELSRSVHLGSGLVAVRVPNHETARAFARAVGHAITATSANISGRPAASTGDEAAARLGDRVEVLVDDGAAPGGPASTIVDATGSEPKLVRVGAIEWSRVLEFLH
jgi:L-threonylcarbamoyladenylate synthase